MNRATIVVLCGFVFGILVPATPAGGSTLLAAEPSETPPEWIWLKADRKPGQSGVLYREFETEERITEAQLRLATEYCSCQVFVNNRAVANLDAYAPWLDLDVTDFMRRGRNSIAVHAKSVFGPAAVAAELMLNTIDGKPQRIATNPNWLAGRVSIDKGRGQEKPLGRPSLFGTVAPEMWNSSIRITAFDNYEQWRQASHGAQGPDPATFATLPGFEIELVRAAEEGEGSWISMAFDPKGRLTISREDKGLLRMTLAEKDGRTSVSKVETINDDLHECRGLIYAHDSLYANANNSKGLYRLRDTNGDDQFDEMKLLREFPGGVGHGRNDIALGPDGMIYLIHGDSVRVPTENIVDHTSPFREARQGKPTTEGYLLRTDNDGSKWELLAAGLRNPYGIDFNDAGELFTYDADAEHDMGAPWYRPTRIDHLVSGADFGWRGLTGKWPPYDPDHAENALPVADIGKGSPTAIHSGRGTNFPEVYQRALFVLDWAYGRILACHLIPRGAGWYCRTETFLKGRPLNVTDLDVGPDGALYVVTGGRKTESTLYRIRYTGPLPDERATHNPTRQQIAREKFCRERRQLRRNLERGHNSVRRPVNDLPWSWLTVDDPVLRHAARIAIEHQPVVTWDFKALDAGTTALLALIRSGKADAVRALMKLNTIGTERSPAWRQTSLFHAYSMLLKDPSFLEKPSDLNNPLLPVTRRRIGDILRSKLESIENGNQAIPIAPAGAGRGVLRELASIAVQIEVPDATSSTMKLLAASREQVDRIHYLFVLRNVKDEWTKELRRDYFEQLGDLDRNALGGAGMPGFLKQIRDEAIKTLSDEEKAALGDLLKPGNAVDPEDLKVTRKFVREWTIDDLDDLLKPTDEPRDLERGRRLFTEALCIRCHRHGGRGGVTGPDLSSVAGRFSRRDILTSILDPSRVIAAKYRNTQVVTLDGKAITGRVVTGGDYRSETLRIASDPLRPAQIIELDKKEIDVHQESPISPMPKGLLNTMTRTEIRDFLEALLHNRK